MYERKKDYTINEIQVERYEYVLRILTEIDIPKNYVVYIHGTGKQSKKTYEELKERKDIEVIWYDFFLKGILTFLQFVVAGYAGLVKINDNKGIKEVFEKISESSMAGIYIIDRNIENIFISEIKKRNEDVFVVNDYIIKNTNNYFIYLIDNDSVESETGVYEIKAIGKECFLQNVL